MKRIALVLGLLLGTLLLPSSNAQAYFWGVEGFGSPSECSDGQNVRGIGKHTLSCIFKTNVIQMTQKGQEYGADLVLQSFSNVAVESLNYRGIFRPLTSSQPCSASGACTVYICRPNITCVDITSSFAPNQGGAGTTSAIAFNWWGYDIQWFALYFQVHGSGSISPTRYNQTDWNGQSVGIDINYHYI